LASSPDLSACDFLFMELFDKEMFQTRSAHLHNLKLRIYKEKIAVSSVVSLECNGLWTEFASASVAMDDIWQVLLGALAELRKVTNSYVMSVRHSAWNDWAPTGRIFVKFDIYVYFEKLSRILKFD
jgi:hypothetical protein